jgi:hypothetical protein
VLPKTKKPPGSGQPPREASITLLVSVVLWLVAVLICSLLTILILSKT